MDRRLNGFCRHGNPALDCGMCIRAAGTGGTQPTDVQQLKAEIAACADIVDRCTYGSEPLDLIELSRKLRQLSAV